MTDIIHRLRRYAGGMCISTPTEQEAADIIEGLRAELSTEKEWVEEYRRHAARLSSEIEAMEKQEPVAEWVDGAFDQYPHLRWREPYKAIVGAKLYTKLYALPGAQVHPAPSVPDGWKLVPIEPTRNMLDCMDLGSNLLYRYRAMLAAAPKTEEQ